MYQYYLVMYLDRGKIAYDSFYTKDYKKAVERAKECDGYLILAENMCKYDKGVKTLW